MAVTLDPDDFQAFYRGLYRATPWYVWSGGNDANSGKAPHAAKATVQGAITAASAGDAIVIGPGTYTGNAEVPNAKPLRLYGAGLGKTILKSADGFALEGALKVSGHCEVEDMSLHGADDGLTNGIWWEPAIQPHQVLSLRRVRLYQRGGATTLSNDAQGAALYVYGQTSYASSALIMEDSEIDTDGYGIFCEDVHAVELRRTRIWATFPVLMGGVEATLLASECELHYGLRGSMNSSNIATGIQLAGRTSIIDHCTLDGGENANTNRGINISSSTVRANVTRSIFNHSANDASKSIVVGHASAELYVDHATRYDPDRVTATGRFEYADESMSATDRPKWTQKHLNLLQA
jgi:hypothetical protein